MLILGLDISSISTGWAILDNDTLLDSGLIKIASNLSHPDKLSQFAHDLKCITRDHDIDWVAIEDQYFQNVVTVKILSRFCGVAIQVMNDIFTLSNVYSPDQLLAIGDKKRSVLPVKGIVLVPPTQLMNLVGLKNVPNREQKKLEIIAWVNETFKKQLKDTEDDVADSIALAYGLYNRIGEVQDAIRDRTQGKAG